MRWYRVFFVREAEDWRNVLSGTFFLVGASFLPHKG